MLEGATTHPMIAVKDLDVAKDFYSGQLGLRIGDERFGRAVRCETAEGTWFLLYRSEMPERRRARTCASRSTTSSRSQRAS